jgi:hypothetical protein
MVTIDAGPLIIQTRRPAPGWSWTTLIAAITLVLAASGLVAYGFDADGLRAAALVVKRFACVVFFAALITGPLGRLSTAGALRTYGALRRDILRGFCASYALYIAFDLAPALWTAQRPTPDMIVFTAFSIVALAFMAAASTNGFKKYLGKSAQHTMLCVTALYFWLCFVLPVLARIDGPYRPDAYYGLCMLFMIGAVLLRFADSCVKAGRGNAAPMR